MRHFERILEELLPVRRGERNQAGYTFAGLQLAPVVKGKALARVHYKNRLVEFEIDDQKNPCPLAAWFLGLHECSHFYDGDLAEGRTATSVRSYDEQEKRAMRFMASVGANYLSDTDLEVCMNCVGGDPMSCNSPSLASIIEKLGNSADVRAQTLGGLLLRAISENPAWFKAAARGMKGPGGQPLITSSTPTNVTPDYNNPPRKLEGRIIRIPRKRKCVVKVV